MELKLGVLGVAIKVVKDVVHLWRHNFEEINFPLPIGNQDSKRPL
jgi:hypothetical protein